MVDPSTDNIVDPSTDNIVDPSTDDNAAQERCNFYATQPRLE
jgi:hypothetical protein